MFADEFEYYRQYTDQNFSIMDGDATFKGGFQEFADWKDREKVLQEEQRNRRALHDSYMRDIDNAMKMHDRNASERERVIQEEQNIRMRIEAEQDRQFQQSMHVMSQSMQGISQGLGAFDMRNSPTLGALGGSGFGAWSNGF